MKKSYLETILLILFLVSNLSQTSNAQTVTATSAENTKVPTSKETKQTDNTQTPTGSGNSDLTQVAPRSDVMITVGGGNQSELPKQSNLKSDSRLAAALMNDDLTALKDLIDNKGVDVETPLDQSGVKALQWAVEWYSSKSELLPVQEQILRFLLERCADKTQPLAWLKQQSAEINEKLDKAVRENYMVRVWQSKKDGNQRVLNIVANAPACTKKTTPNQKQSEDETISTTDWVDGFNLLTRWIMIRNNSKKRWITITAIYLHTCENVAIKCSGDGSAGGGWNLAPGAIGAFVAVMPSDSQKPMTFQYNYYAEFMK